MITISYFAKEGHGHRVNYPTWKEERAGFLMHRRGEASQGHGIVHRTKRVNCCDVVFD